ncbi:MAG: transposase [Limisphaerales bacterium]
MRRIKLESGAAVYHCIGRMVGGELKLGDSEKEYFRGLLWRLADFCGLEVITYCVMSNHVHLLVRVPPTADVADAEICRRMVRYYGRREPWVQLAESSLREKGALPEQIRKRLIARMGDISPFMQSLKQRFARWFNRRHNRFGTLWAERFKSLLVEESDESLQTVAMYIDLNPLRAGIVKDPKDYRFCGHAEAVAGNKAARRANVGISDSANWRSACAAYRKAMLLSAGDSTRSNQACLSPKEVLRVLRRGGQVNLAKVLRLRLRYLSDGVVFGSREFVEEVFQKYRERFGAKRTQGPRSMAEIRSVTNLTCVRELKKNAVG